MILSFSDLKKNLKKPTLGLKQVKVAVLGDSATQLFVQALRGSGIGGGLNLDVFEAGYDQLELQVYDSESDLFNFKPENILFYQTTEKLLKRFYSLGLNNRSDFATREIDRISSINARVSAILPSSKVLWFNFFEKDDGVFGNFANKIDNSFLYQVRKLNLYLMELAQKQKNMYLVDICAILNNHMGLEAQDSKHYYTSDLVFGLEILPYIAKNCVDIFLAMLGTFKKVLILDLDNTMWGGIIGDDGVENIQIGDLGLGRAFTELQKWIKELKNRGIILAVCSKNNESVAKEPFEKHPEMILRLVDIAVFVANWDSKVDNIKQIRDILNVGFDSMVFLDDNPYERNIVRENLPLITVPELPLDPADYLTYLKKLNLFETISFTINDTERTRQYQEESNRFIAQKSFTSEASFLQNLNMVSDVRNFDKFNIPRVAQLSQRSNQFNLRTVRYTEDDLLRISKSKEHINFAISLADRFGDYGLISVLILKIDQNAGVKQFFINTWLMSCRVLKRDVENLALNSIVGIAKELGVSKVIGEFIPTSKNELVKDHFRNLGFENREKLWELNVENFNERPHFIC